MDAVEHSFTLSQPHSAPLLIEKQSREATNYLPCSTTNGKNDREERWKKSGVTVIYTPVLPTPRKWRQEDLEFKIILGYKEKLKSVWDRKYTRKV